MKETPLNSSEQSPNVQMLENKLKFIRAINIVLCVCLLLLLILVVLPQYATEGGLGGRFTLVFLILISSMIISPIGLIELIRNFITYHKIRKLNKLSPSAKTNFIVNIILGLISLLPAFYMLFIILSNILPHL